jgi:hypothetical protein
MKHGDILSIFNNISATNPSFVDNNSLNISVIPCLLTKRWSFSATIAIAGNKSWFNNMGHGSAVEFLSARSRIGTTVEIAINILLSG